ncbi:MAG TPA: 50S ribosomal protein L1 [Buchnera sp. (in: enterobacteria)]|nr:50S ribosomal protein L1 [Buchnera sp. (in: enterobacteria)]
MTKLTKKNKYVKNTINLKKIYHFDESIECLKKIKTKNFIESIDVAIHLGIDAKKSEQNIRGCTILPHGVGRDVKVAVFTEGLHVKSAKLAGADFIGMQDLFDKIKKENLKFNVVIASPNAMALVGKLGPVLGPKGLMPNPKFGTVTENIFEAVKNAKIGQVRYRNDKNGIIHSTIGRITFLTKNIKENLNTLLSDLKKYKPLKCKGTYIKKITLSTTMGPGMIIDQSTL